MIKARRLMLDAFGHPPVLRTADLAPPGPGEVLLRIRAAGLNFADLLTIEGRYQDIPPLPLAMGMECAGEIAAVGPGVGLRVGQRVAVQAGQGGLAEAGLFPAAACLPLPDAVSDTVAAGFQIAYGTAHLALADRARLHPGETVIVTGAAGGTGLTAVEVAAAAGARVIAVARGAEKLALARAAGAEKTVDSDTPELKAALKSAGGADVVFDTVGGDMFRPCLSALRPLGRYLVIGFAGGAVPQIPANHLLVKNVDVIGVWWGGYAGFAPARMRQSLEELAGWIAAGRVRPHIGHCLPFDDWAAGLELIRSRQARGKVVLTM